MLENKDFYPTPEKLVKKMFSKVKGHPQKILEPSAGKGDIIEAIIENFYHHARPDVSAIELDTELQATLRGKNISVIDSDFLSYSGLDKFDAIIANPPFASGEKHLLKAIDIMYRGEIVFLLNAETIKKPSTLLKQELVKKLAQLNAVIEYIQDAFKTAERPTGVEVALIYINIERKVEDDLFAGCTDQVHTEKQEIGTDYEVSTKKTIEEFVASYDQVVKIGTETIVNYYRNYRKVGLYLTLRDTNDKDGYNRDGDLTCKMQDALNSLLKNVRKDFWRKTLSLEEVRKRLTTKKQSEFVHQLDKYSTMDFTEGNIRQFVINFIGGFSDTLTEATLEIFDEFSREHCYSDGLYDDNIHLFNGWKTNKAFRVSKKVIIPIRAGYNKGPFIDDWSGKWKLQYGAEGQLRDIDAVMNFFDGNSDYLSITQAIKEAFERGESRNIQSTYFTITCYKKGTMHLAFNSDDILRRFNVAATLGKSWLPHDYGNKAYQECSDEEKTVIDSFEGAQEYNDHLGQPLFSYPKDQLFLAA